MKRRLTLINLKYCKTNFKFICFCGNNVRFAKIVVVRRGENPEYSVLFVLPRDSFVLDHCFDVNFCQPFPNFAPLQLIVVVTMLNMPPSVRYQSQAFVRSTCLGKVRSELLCQR